MKSYKREALGRMGKLEEMARRRGYGGTSKKEIFASGSFFKREDKHAVVFIFR